MKSVSRAKLLALLALATVGAAALTNACVADEAASGSDGGSTSEAGGGDDGSGGSIDGASSDGASQGDGSTASDGGGDAGPNGPDTGPQVICGHQATNGFYTTCTASPAAMNAPGGLLDDGTYYLSRFWRNGNCGLNENKNLGSMTLFHQGGHAFMQYMIASTPPSGGTGTPRYGTLHLAADADGGIVRIAVCDDAGTSTGSFERTYDGGDQGLGQLIFEVNDYQEVWDKQ